MTVQTAETGSATLNEISQEMQRIFQEQRTYQQVVKISSAKTRIAKLKRMLTWTLKNKGLIRDALQADFRKPIAETDLSEILVVTTELRHAIRNLRKWMKPKRVKPTLALATTRSKVMMEPRGVVLIISPWNYPFNLAIGPLISAVAAGNCAIIKPSESTPNTSALIKTMIGELFEAREVAVFEGGPEVSSDLLELPFNHVFFTGSPRVGKIVMAAAARHLSSVTLELGGKSPVIIDETANLKDSAQKIVAGKFLNTGQTCVAPDYLLVHQSRHDALIELIKAHIKSAYGDSPAAQQETPDFGRLVNDRHFARLSKMIDEAREAGAKFEAGGECDASQRYIAPTLITGITADEQLMQEEIFGPILPVLTYTSLPEAISFINARPKPLALYIFSKRKRNVKKILAETSAGGSCVNEIAVQFLHTNLPFGGINTSGIGNSHGYYGFKAFSHERAVLKHNSLSPFKLLHPPYTKSVQRMIDMVVKYL